MQPDVIVLDEPLAGLDHPTQIKLIEKLTELNGDGISIVAVTHDVEELIFIADRIAVLEGGELELDTTPIQALSEGLSSYGVREPLYIELLRDIGKDIGDLREIDSRYELLDYLSDLIGD